MKRITFLTIINLVLALFQISFFPELLNQPYGPNLVLGYAFSLFLLGVGNLAYLSGFIGGILLDILGTGQIGISSTVIVSSLVISYFVRSYVFKGWFSNIVLLFLSSVLFTFILTSFSNLDREVFLTACFTLVLTGPMYYVNLHTISRVIKSRFIQIRFKDL